MQYILMDYVNEAGWPQLTKAEQEQSRRPTSTPRSRGLPDPRLRFTASSRCVRSGTAHC
jgi:hypothetical protein